MKKLHKHAELIKAWADGAVIEAYKPDTETWYLEHPLEWNSFRAYRIKPTPKPDVVEDVFVWKSPMDGYPMMVRHDIPNIRLIFDGESQLFKNVVVLK